MKSNEITTVQDLINLKEELLKGITTILKQKSPEHKEWLKSADIRKMLGISPGTLQTLRINGSIPFTKLNGTLYYSYNDVIKVLDRNKKNTGK